jgi:hypothetical protein
MSNDATKATIGSKFRQHRRLLVKGDDSHSIIREERVGEAQCCLLICCRNPIVEPETSSSRTRLKGAAVDSKLATV